MRNRLYLTIFAYFLLCMLLASGSALAQYNSSKNPAPVGTPVKSMVELGSVYSAIYDITVTVLETVRGKDAMDLLKKADSKNKKPVKGFEYILARVRFELKARAVSDRLTMDIGDSPLQWVALASDLTEYSGVSVTVPSPALEGRVKPGGTLEGWVAFAVDKKDTGPTMVFDPDTGGATGRGNTLFFKLYTGDDSRTAKNSTSVLMPYFTPAGSSPKALNEDGFIQRWLLLEPIAKPIRTNTLFTDSYIRKAFYTEYFPGQFTVIPKNGDTVKAEGKELKWHAVDSQNFNVKLFRFAYNLEKPHYGVLFWAVTVVNSPREIKNVRLAVGSNSASMWWFNEEEAVTLSGDRRMVMDDSVSGRVTLKKGPNIIRGAVINGPGMSDFCVRFINEKGDPVRDLTVGF